MPGTFHHPGLHRTLMLQVVLPVLLLLALLLALALNVLADVREDRLQRDLRQVARAVQLPVARALESGDDNLLFSNLESVFELSEVYGAYVFDADGRRQASFGTVRPSASQSLQAVNLGMVEEQEFDQYEQISGRDVYSFFLPLFDTVGQPNGLLQVTRRRSDIEQELAQLHAWSWGSSAAFLSVLTLLLYGAHRRAIGKPLDRLLASMQRIRNGDLQHRATPVGPAEFRGLAHGLNSMLDAIAEARQKTHEERVARVAIADRLRQSETLALLGQIAGGVAHELGAPLSVVDGRAQRILRSCEDPSMRGELESIRQQAHRMQALLEQLLSLGRNSREPLSPVDPAVLIRAAMVQVPEGTERVQIIPGPAVRPRLRVQALEQAIANLVRNALQSAPDSRVEAGWDIRRTSAGAEFCLYVQDTGPGIAAEVRDSMFEPFISSKRPGEGSGMGLAIVRRIVEEHDGSIEVDSSPGGSRFVVCLPLANASGAEA